MFEGASDCGDTTPLFTIDATPQTAAGFVAVAAFTVPASVQGNSFFVRITNPVTGQRNYTEIFAVQPMQVTNPAAGCVINPQLPLGAVPELKCPELDWNVTLTVGGKCTIEANGCRTWRTSNNGGWYNRFKPVYECTALLSPRPSAAGVKEVTGVTLGPVVPGGPC
jgi:hypothetical protein